MTGRKSARLSAEWLPDIDDMRPENDKQTPELHETMWSEIADDETLPEMHEIAEDETLPEMHEIAAEFYEIAEDETSPEVKERRTAHIVSTE